MQDLPSDDEQNRVMRKAAWRLVPFIGLLYFVSFLDRVNIGFAALTMNADLGFSASIYGAGAGIFFLGYFLFEVPSNLILERVGARRWIARIMISWGVLSAATAFVWNPASFYTVRFLLGLAEAGFFPGMILYLTYWFPQRRRAQIMGAFLVAIPLSSALGGPISTLLLELDAYGLRGWQWLFLLEGAPALLLGIVVLLVLPDRPSQASFLTPQEAALLESMVATDTAMRKDHRSVLRALTSPRIWLYCGVYFGIVIGLYGLGFWLPQIVKSFGGLENREIGLVAAIPYLAASLCMVWWSRHSDATKERRWHVALPALVGACGLIAASMAPTATLSLAAMTISAIGIYAALPVFWALPTAELSGPAAAGGIALINSIGNLSGYVGPVIFGRLRDATGSYTAGLGSLAACMIAAAILVAVLARGAPTRKTEAA
ncbi:MAG: major facilitator superfamily 1 [Rhodospirillales bacterium]|nr:major facilitator superfamily 1 [Rhodospirillales bacterium]